MRDHAGVGIDLDLDDVAAVGKGLRRRHAVMRGVEPGLHAGRQLRRIARRLRDLEQIDAQVGADDAELAVAEVDVGAEASSRCAAICVPLSMILRAGLVQRRAADGERARAAGQPARRAVGVAHDHVDAVGVDAELVRDELLVRR